MNRPYRTPMTLPKTLRFAAGLLTAFLLTALPVLAQEGGGPASQTLGRPFRFVFLAYAIAWIFAFGWIVSVARRMSDLDKRLRD